MVDKNPNLLMNYTKLKTNLASYKLDKAPHTNPFRTQENLWIYSPPGTGKTYYATHLYLKTTVKVVGWLYWTTCSDT